MDRRQNPMLSLVVMTALLAAPPALAAGTSGSPGTSAQFECGSSCSQTITWPGPACGPVYDGQECSFMCREGTGFYVSGRNNHAWYDYDGYAKCGGTTIHCRADRGPDGCRATGVSPITSSSDSFGRCWAYNDWGPTETTSCGWTA